MRRRHVFLLFLSFIGGIGFFISSVKDCQAAPKPTIKASAEIKDVKSTLNYYDVTINYHIEGDNKLIIQSDRDNDEFDLEHLEDYFGEDAVTENDKQNKVTIDVTQNIDKEFNGSFVLRITKRDISKFKITDFNGKTILSKTLDANDYTDEEGDGDGTDETDENGQTWYYTKNLRISKGPVKKHSDGSKVVPYLYFGDYYFASEGMSLADAYKPTKVGRTNSMTAPNAAVGYFAPDSGVEDADLNKEGNHIYTTGHGDGQFRDNVNGSMGTFVANTLSNYVKVTDKKSLPSVSGPDIVGKSYGMMGIPYLYYRIDPRTGYEEQKLTFYQQDRYRAKKGHDLSVISTSIIQKFDRSGKVITEIQYKNTGKGIIDNFMGFAMRDFTLNKDEKQITDDENKTVGDYIPMRALGNKRGMYIQSGNNELRSSIYMNYNDGPLGWAARSTGLSYKSIKGYSTALLGLLGSGANYPWEPGKGKVKWGIYKSPDVPKHLYNGFKDINDLADAGIDYTAGSRLGSYETDKNWDSGLLMRTKLDSLLPDEAIKLTYATQNDVVGKTYDPTLYLDQDWTEKNPDIVDSSEKEYELNGTWYDFDSTSEELFYTIDTEDQEKGKTLKQYVQEKNDADAGMIHDWKEKVSLEGLKPGLHTIRVWMKDAEGHPSETYQTVININKVATVEPQIDILSPDFDKDNPFSPIKSSLKIKGVWSDKDSQTIKSIKYSIDDQTEENIVAENIENTKPGESVDWQIKKLDIKEHNDLNLHEIKFKITDDQDLTGTTSFYFKHDAGTYQIVAPSEIDLGTHNLLESVSSMSKPKFKGKVKINDRRPTDSAPINLTLLVDEFHKKDDEEKVLKHDIYWDKNQINSDEFVIGGTQHPKDDSWNSTTDLTNEVKNKMRISFNDQNHTGDGVYESTWTWKVVDSL